MIRFKKFGGSTALPIKGCIKPEGAKMEEHFEQLVVESFDFFVISCDRSLSSFTCTW